MVIPGDSRPNTGNYLGIAIILGINLLAPKQLEGAKLYDRTQVLAGWELGILEAVRPLNHTIIGARFRQI